MGLTQLPQHCVFLLLPLGEEDLHPRKQAYNKVVSHINFLAAASGHATAVSKCSLRNRGQEVRAGLPMLAHSEVC